MFTGIIEETGELWEVKKETLSARIKIRCRKVLEGTKVGEIGRASCRERV